MEDHLKEIFLSEALQGAEISLLLTEGDTVLLSYQSNLPLIPASNTKLFISAAALVSQKETILFPPLQTFAQGAIAQGVLAGDLILDSCGSLVFTARYSNHNDFEAKNQLLTEQVKRYAEQLRSAGVTTIKGDIKLSFERWDAPPENKHYTAAAAFSFNENTVETLVEDGALQTVPENPAVFTFANTPTVAAQDVADANHVRYNGKVNSSDFWRISNTSAVEYALSMLRRGLREHGIKILGQPSKPVKEKKLLFETGTVMETEEFIQPLNCYSDNFRAEILALSLTRAKTGKAAYTDVNETIHSIFAEFNLQLNSLQLEDGSGLSRNNRASASDIVALLQFIENHESFEPFRNSMALAGKTGTLENRFRDTPWENCFYGKTGTLNGVSALSGYWFRDNKPTITFSFIGNGASDTIFWQALEKLAVSLNHLN